MTELLSEIISANQKFVQNEQWKEFLPVDGKPQRKTAVLTCMDTRLTGFILPALGLKRGDVKVIKTAGNSLLNNTQDPVIFSLVAAVFEMGIEEILVIGHDDCGIAKLKAEGLCSKMQSRGISTDAVKGIEDKLRAWLGHFKTIEDNVKWVCRQIQTSPLLPGTIQVHGLVMNPQTGQVRVV